MDSFPYRMGPRVSKGEEIGGCMMDASGGQTYR